MSRSRGAHAAPSGGRNRAIAWLAALALGGGGMMWWSPWASDSAAGEGSSPSNSTSKGSSVQTPTADARGCPTPLTFWTGTERDPFAADLDSAFVKSLGKTCPAATGDKVWASDPASAAITLTVPDAPVTESVASTPVVLALPKEMATELGWPQPLMPEVVQDLFNGDKTWKSLGHPEWGAFRIASPDPQKTLVGAVGFGTLTALANGGNPLTEAPDYYAPTKADFAVIHSEQKITTLTDTVAEANNLLDAVSTDDFARTVSAVLTTERDVIVHNAGNPQVEFVSIPLGAGAATVPLVVAASDASGENAKAFADYARTPGGQITLQAAGWRSPKGAPPTIGTDSLGVTALEPAVFDEATIGAVRGAWTAMHTHGSTMALIDLSGSMNLPFPGSKLSRLDLVRTLANKAYDVASPKAASTVWFFHTSGGRDIVDDGLTLEINDTPVGGGQIHSDKIRRAVRDARAGGGTPLYLAVRKAYQHASKNYREGYLNQLIVLSDGNNEAAANSMTLKQLSDYVKKTYNPKKPVSISHLIIDPEGRIGPLKEVADLTMGVTVRVRSMKDVPEAFAQALFATP